MASFTMKWPELGIEILCESIDKNQDVFETFAANLPTKALQGHEMLGGWILRDRSVIFSKKKFAFKREELSYEQMKDAPVGRVSLLNPLGKSAELLVKYGDCVDDRNYVPFAQVAAADIEKLQKAAKDIWKSAVRTKEVIIVEFE